MYKNILLKLSGESLMSESENINKEKKYKIKLNKLKFTIY